MAGASGGEARVGETLPKLGAWARLGGGIKKPPVLGKSQVLLKSLSHFASIGTRPPTERTLAPRNPRRGAFANKWSALEKGVQHLAALEERRLEGRAARGLRETKGMQAKGDADSTWWDQGDDGMHTQASWRARLELRQHPAVTEELHRWWELVHTTYLADTRPSGEEILAIGFNEYLDLQLKFYRVLISPWDEYDACQCARQDWTQDVGGGDKLDRTHLMDCMFEMADTCVSYCPLSC